MHLKIQGKGKNDSNASNDRFETIMSPPLIMASFSPHALARF